MGRYKSVLEAEQDASELPFAVDIPIPADGISRRMDKLTHWLSIHAKGYWAQHANTVDDQHMVGFHFSSPWDAKNFEDWLKSEEMLK